jgi:putative redox protein
MPSKSFTFKNRRGLRLAGRLDLPENEAPRSVALYAHCFTCGKDLKGAFHLSRTLARAGVAVLRFDFTGIGASQGRFGQTTFTSSVEDLEDAAGYLARVLDAPRLLIGHSLGGAAALMAAGRLGAVRAVATVGAPADPAHVLRHLEGRREAIETQGEARVEIAGRSFTVGRQFIEDVSAVRLHQAVQRLEKPLLVLHAPLDETVGIDHAARIFGAARHPKSFVSLDRADHLLTRPDDARYAGSLIAAWAAPYLAASSAHPAVSGAP